MLHHFFYERALSFWFSLKIKDKSTEPWIKNKYVNVKISIALQKYSLQTENLYLNIYLMVIIVIFFPH